MNYGRIVVKSTNGPAESVPQELFTDFEYVTSPVLAEQLARGDMACHGGQRDLHFWIEQQSQSLLESMPPPPREDTFLDDLGDEAIDPRGRFVAGGMPHRPHELWMLLEDPTVPRDPVPARPAGPIHAALRGPIWTPCGPGSRPHRDILRSDRGQAGGLGRETSAHGVGCRRRITGWSRN